MSIHGDGESHVSRASTAGALEADVLVVGGGPVGMTLALDLAARGRSVVLAEQRDLGAPPTVKCNHISARSMEYFRRLGVAAALRSNGLPVDYPHDAAARTAVNGYELCRVRIPSRGQRYTATYSADGWWPTPEPPHRMNQTRLEPILAEHLRNARGVTVLDRTTVDKVWQTDTEVQAEITGADTGQPRRVRARYAVGADGGRSLVRRTMGAKLVGDDIVTRVQSTYIHAPDLLALFGGTPAWLVQVVNPRRRGHVIAIDGRERWLVHNPLLDHEADFDAVDRHWAIRNMLGVTEEFRYEVLSVEDYTGRRLVADRFRDGRLFLCGDAAHLWPPVGGYGMNAGLADAADLAWLLAARLDGWAADGILDAYERERRPVNDQVSRYVVDAARRRARNRAAVPAEIEDRGVAGERARATAGEQLYRLNLNQYCCGGLNFGYCYDESPIIWHDGTSGPGYTMYEFTQSTVPGARTPHVWLAGRRSLYDAMGAGFTLLCLNPDLDVSGMVTAAAGRGVPLTVLTMAPDEAGDAYDHPLVLSRPDRHVAWRGHMPPQDPAKLMDLVRGA